MQYDLTPDEAAVIESIRAVNLQTRRKRAALVIGEISKKNYWFNPHASIFPAIVNILQSNGFTAPDFDIVTLGETEGAHSSYNFDCKGAYLTVVCYRMKSGYWEIVVYLS